MAELDIESEVNALIATAIERMAKQGQSPKTGGTPWMN